jgi:hypothetical protein
LLEALRSISDANLGCPEEGENERERPWGTPVAERVTVDGLPAVRSTETAALPLPPCVKTDELGVTTRAKLNAPDVEDVPVAWVEAVVVTAALVLAEEEENEDADDDEEDDDKKVDDELDEVELPEVDTEELEEDDDVELELEDALELVPVVIATPGAIIIAEGLPIANVT